MVDGKQLMNLQERSTSRVPKNQISKIETGLVGRMRYVHSSVTTTSLRDSISEATAQHRTQELRLQGSSNLREPGWPTFPIPRRTSLLGH
jgi:hypothetical protein